MGYANETRSAPAPWPPAGISLPVQRYKDLLRSAQRRTLLSFASPAVSHKVGPGVKENP